MFYDLNVPYNPGDSELARTLAFLHELGYDVAALNHTIIGKLPADISSAVPATLPLKGVPSKLQLLRRVTLVLTDALQNARLNELAKNYDILALRPTDEKTLQLACGSYDCDIISLDLTIRHSFPFKHKTLSEAIKAGKRLEICYSQGLLGDANARRNLISNATQLIKASRGRGVIVSSEAKRAVGLRGPWDAINLAAVWGLGQERGYEAMSKEARSAVVGAKLKRTGYRGVVDVIYGGEKVDQTTQTVSQEDGAVPKVQHVPARKRNQPQQSNGLKRKADVLGGSDGVSGSAPAEGVSKRELKRRAKAARVDVAEERGGANGHATT